MGKLKKGYILVLILLLAVSSAACFSYAYFTSKNEEHGKLNIVAGDLEYKIESDSLENNQITLASNETKDIELKITSLNDIDSKYELYYTSTDDISMYYDSEYESPNGTINSKNTKNLRLQVVNNSDSEVTVTFGVQGGLVNHSLSLIQGNKIENELELCPYELGEVVGTFEYTGNVQEFIAQCNGIYKFEVYGAQGGNATYSTTSYTGGKGGYSSGNYLAMKNSKIFITVGGMGVTNYSDASTSFSTNNGNGYNGGAKGSTFVNNSAQGGGGGATHIATINRGELENYQNNKNEILIIAGGGGGAAAHTSAPSWSGNGGSGGGLTGQDAQAASSSTYCNASGGTQQSGGLQTNNNNSHPTCIYNGTFGLGSGSLTGTDAAYSGGGGGYYGGAGGHHGPGAGGSGYIDGVIDGITKNGVREGNGYVKITYLGNKEQQKWVQFLVNGGYTYDNYNSLSDAMSDNTINSNIFNNQKAMEYLVQNEDLIADIKKLDNYSSELVSQLLSSTVYTNNQKYSYGLPFYLYDKGTYDKSLFSLDSYVTTSYLTVPSITYKDTGSNLYFNANFQPNACSTVRIGSSVSINVDKYVKLTVNINNYNSQLQTDWPPAIGLNRGVSTSLSVSKLFSSNGIHSVSINVEGISGTYTPVIHIRPCYNLTSNGTYLSKNINYNISQWWFE